MLSKKLYRSDMINCALCHDAPCSSVRIRRPVLCRTKIPVRDVPRRVRRRVCALIRYRSGSW